MFDPREGLQQTVRHLVLSKDCHECRGKYTRMFTSCVPFAYRKCGILDKKWHSRPPLYPPETDCT